MKNLIKLFLNVFGYISIFAMLLLSLLVFLSINLQGYFIGTGNSIIVFFELLFSIYALIYFSHLVKKLETSGLRR